MQCARPQQRTTKILCPNDVRQNRKLSLTIFDASTSIMFNPVLGHALQFLHELICQQVAGNQIDQIFVWDDLPKARPIWIPIDPIDPIHPKAGPDPHPPSEQLLPKQLGLKVPKASSSTPAFQAPKNPKTQRTTSGLKEIDGNCVTVSHDGFR